MLVPELFHKKQLEKSPLVTLVKNLLYVHDMLRFTMINNTHNFSEILNTNTTRTYVSISSSDNLQTELTLKSKTSTEKPTAFRMCLYECVEPSSTLVTLRPYIY